jgi:hypothetical protein
VFERAASTFTHYDSLPKRHESMARAAVAATFRAMCAAADPARFVVEPRFASQANGHDCGAHALAVAFACVAAAMAPPASLTLPEACQRYVDAVEGRAPWQIGPAEAAGIRRALIEDVRLASEQRRPG